MNNDVDDDEKYHSFSCNTYWTPYDCVQVHLNIHTYTYEFSVWFFSSLLVCPHFLLNMEIDTMTGLILYMRICVYVCAINILARKHSFYFFELRIACIYVRKIFANRQPKNIECCHIKSDLENSTWTEAKIHNISTQWTAQDGKSLELSQKLIALLIFALNSFKGKKIVSFFFLSASIFSLRSVGLFLDYFASSVFLRQTIPFSS